MTKTKEVSFMAGGIFSDKKGAVSVRRFTSTERENISLMMSELAVLSPLTARALIKRRVSLANEVVAAGLSTLQGSTFDITVQPNSVLDTLPYLENIDDLIDAETMAIINKSAEKEGDQ